MQSPQTNLVKGDFEWFSQDVYAGAMMFNQFLKLHTYLSVYVTLDNNDMTFPDPDDSAAIFSYAMSFNAFERYGSFEATADIARKAPRSSLDEVRAELFFKARAARHRGDNAYVETYRELLPLLEAYSNG